MNDGKFSHLSLINQGKVHNEIFDTVYSANYDASFAYLAQAQRHRTINYEINKIKTGEFFTPKILLPNNNQVDEWQSDLYSVKDKTSIITVPVLVSANLLTVIVTVLPLSTLNNRKFYFKT